jgi:hypothetical protein
MQHYKPPPKDLPGFPNARRVRPKTAISKDATQRRPRWKMPDGRILEWDSRHGALEVYNSRGHHLGEFNPETGRIRKDKDPTRRIDP